MAAMAIEARDTEFDVWLGRKLRDLNTDEGVFGSYIKGILNGDESNDEKAEALEGIISEITENDTSGLCREILDQWQRVDQSKSAENKTSEEDVEKKLVKLLESQTIQTVQQKQHTAEEKRVRDAILAQYSKVQDENEFEVQEESGDIGIEKNTNVASIQQAVKERRELAKLESQKKKEKDKEDREKQKQQQAEKKEKRKTQKQERRR